MATGNRLATQLRAIVARKKSNLIISLDVTHAADILQLADSLGPYVCMMKTHIDIVDDFSPALVEGLVQCAKKHDFMLFEDRKFADIGHTVALQYGHGIYRIADWADIINAHTLPGEGCIAGLKSIGLAKQKGLLLIAQMSAKDTLFDAAYADKTLALARANQDFVMGFICQQRLADDGDFLYITPGVQWQAQGDHLGQQYRSPEVAILEDGCDLIIVGRGIIQADDPKAMAAAYQARAWRAYVDSPFFP